jgi:two-component system chemotaxis response regulator CheY
MMKSVVIIDDSKFIADRLAKFFKDTMKFNVIGTSTNGLEAIGLYRDLQPDLLSLDVNIPIFNGLEVVEEIIREFPNARILIVSAVCGDSVMDCIAAGAADFINKPLAFRDPEFVSHFEEVVNRIVP